MPANLISIFGASGIAALGINGQAIIIQLITFILVLLVLKKWAVKPILKVLQNRRELIEKGVKLGEEMEKKQTELDKKVSDTLHSARNEADSILTGAEQQKRSIIQEAEDKAREKAEKIVSDADSQIKQDVLRAKKDLEKEMVGLISDATEAIIDEKVDAKKDAALIDKALRGREAA